MMESGMENPKFRLQEDRDISLSNTSESLPSDMEQLLQNDSYMEEASKAQTINVPEERGWRKMFAYIGPGFLVAIAYLDPGNLESDLQAGAQYKYELLWVLLVATISGTLIQSLAANLGIVTGKHLAEHCREEYSTKARLILWLLAEVAIVASDIPEVIGTAYALDMIFHLPLWIGVLFTGFSTMTFLALQQYGIRKLELFISSLVVVIASCFLIELHYAKPSVKEVVKGLFLPSLQGQGATGLAISLIGAMVMPHNLYLHSALVLTRRTPKSTQGIKDGCRYNLIECSFALFMSFAINLAVVSVTGAACSNTSLTLKDIESCKDLDLNRASFLLKNVLGKSSSKLFAVALFASGQSSTITGTYAGQYVMQGFLELRFEPWIRNLLTRLVAIVPSLVVALIGGSSAAGKLIIVSSMILAFELPFALIPLLKFTSNPAKMGPHANSNKIRGLAWAIGTCIIIVNIYYLINGLFQWMLATSMSAYKVVFTVLAGFVALSFYISFIAYLAFRKDRRGVYVLPEMVNCADLSHGANGCNTKSHELVALPHDRVIRTPEFPEGLN